MADSEIVERLDAMLAVLQLAHHDAIERAREDIRSDALRAAILDCCSNGRIPSGGLKAAAAAAVKGLGVPASPRTIEQRLNELVARRALKRRGETRGTEYRATGLV